MEKQACSRETPWCVLGEEQLAVQSGFAARSKLRCSQVSLYYRVRPSRRTVKLRDTSFAWHLKPSKNDYGGWSHLRELFRFRLHELLPTRENGGKFNLWYTGRCRRWHSYHKWRRVPLLMANRGELRTNAPTGYVGCSTRPTIGGVNHWSNLTKGRLAMRPHSHL